MKFQVAFNHAIGYLKAESPLPINIQPTIIPSHFPTRPFCPQTAICYNRSPPFFVRLPEKVAAVFRTSAAGSGRSNKKEAYVHTQTPTHAT